MAEVLEMEGEAEKTLICDALAFMRRAIAEKYKNDIFNLPRNGKSVATAGDDANEQNVVDRIKAIDAVLESYVEMNEKFDAVRQSSSLPSSPPWDVTRTASNLLDDFEPYINPFSGLWVVPDHPDQPGPSGSLSQVRDITTSNAADNQQPSANRESSSSKYKIESTEWSQLGDPLADVHASYRHLPSELSSWENPDGDSMAVKQREVLTEPCKNTVNSLGSNPFEILTEPQFKVDNPEYANTDKQYIDRTLQDFEDYFKSLDTSQPKTTDQTFPLNELDFGPPFPARVPTTDFPDDLLSLHVQSCQESAFLAYKLDRSYQEQQNVFDMDRWMAMQLANDVPQDYQELVQVEENMWKNQRQQLNAIQEEIHQQDQQEIEASLAQMRRLQDEWNQATYEIHRQEQEMARQIAEQLELQEVAQTLKDMRQLQEQMQADDDLQLTVDRRLAREIAARENPGQIPNDWQDYPPPTWSDPPPYTETRSLAGTSGEQIDSPVPRPPPALQTLGPSRRVHQTHFQPPLATGLALSATDRDVISDSLSAASNIHAQWYDEIHKNEMAVKAAQEEIDRLKQQERQRMDHLRQEEENRLAEERRRMEEQRQIADEKRRDQERRARLGECSVCGDEADHHLMCRLACGHYYCHECLLTSMQNAIKDKKAFRCCKRRADLPLVSQFIPYELAQGYAALTEELDTPNPTYCSNPTCSIFISPAHCHGDIARCPTCATESCCLCKEGVHHGICKQDAAGQALLSLGNKKRWATCPHCNTMVERTKGCLHMTCRCGRDFCYNCGRPSSECNGNGCKRR